MISPLSSYPFPSYSPFHRIGLPCFQSVTTWAPNMYSLICSGSVNAAHTLLSGAAMSVSAVATKSFTSPPSARYVRRQDAPAPAHDPRGDGQHGGLHGVRQGERDERNDGNYRQLEGSLDDPRIDSCSLHGASTSPCPLTAQGPAIHRAHDVRARSLS